MHVAPGVYEGGFKTQTSGSITPNAAALTPSRICTNTSKTGFATTASSAALAGNAAKLAQLEAGKNALEKAPKPVPRAPADPVEAYVAEVAPQWPRSAQWLRSHPDFVTDKNKNQQMLKKLTYFL